MLRPRDLRCSSGTQTFLEAMHGGKVHLARFVLDALDRRIVNTPAGAEGRSPLMHAVCLREAELRGRFVRLLLEKGADVNLQDGAGRTALSLACELGHLDVLKILVQHSADPEIADRAGNRPLMYAASCGHSGALLFLLRSYKRFGLRLDAANRAGVTALHAARLSGHRECERALSAHSPEPHRGEDQARVPGHREDKPRTRPILERFSRSFSHRKDNSLPPPGTPHEGLRVPEPIHRAHSWDGAVRGGSPTAPCRLLRRVTLPDFCQGLYTGDRRDSICSRSLLILPTNRQQALAL